MAELDDLSGVVLMVLLVAIASALRTSSNDSTLAIVTMASVIILPKGAGFLAALYLIARSGKRYIAQFLKKTGAPDSILLIVGTGLLISALVSLLGFSIAIGGFFAAGFSADTRRRSNLKLCSYRHTHYSHHSILSRSA
ncbi:MAG: hypothetical protein ACPGQV_17170 [Alphaproteobacteria bacterium]